MLLGTDWANDVAGTPKYLLEQEEIGLHACIEIANPLTKSLWRRCIEAC